MKVILWTIVLLSSFYSFGHAYFLIKGKNKLGAIGVVIVGVSILICPFFIRMK